MKYNVYLDDLNEKSPSYGSTTFIQDVANKEDVISWIQELTQNPKKLLRELVDAKTFSCFIISDEQGFLVRVTVRYA